MALTPTSRVDALDYIHGLRSVLESLPLGDLDAAVECLRAAYTRGSQVFLVGNGGSASTASHMACDLAKTVMLGTGDVWAKRFRVVSLTDNVALMTAWANDTSYANVFAEQLRNIANAGDILIAISVSGNSPNIVQAVSLARRMAITTISLLGCDGGTVRKLSDLCVVVNSTDYGYVEDAHLVLNHLITSHLKARLFE